jgi:hypothetical protein
MPINPAISLGVKPLEFQMPNALAQAGQVMQLQQAQSQMDRLRRTDEALERIRQVAMKNGGPSDLTEIAQAYMQSPDANHQELGLKILQQQRDKADYERIVGGFTPTASAAPATTPNALAPAAPDVAPAAPANALATPAATAPVAPNAALVAQTQDRINRLMQFASIASPQMANNALAQARVLQDQLELYSKPDRAKPAALQELEAYMSMSPEQKAAFEKLQKIKAPGTTVAVNTATGKSLAAPVGQRAEASLVKAEGASGIMENANMVREALNSGNVIAGTLAGPRLKFAQLMETVGAGDKQKLVNTRNAVQGLAAMTLESRAELKGQGQVTENEQKLLERARSGNIEEMTVAELQQIVNVSQRLASRLWSNHETLLKTMESDPAAADALRYYRPTTTLPKALGEGKPQTSEKADERKQGLDAIFGGKR